MNNPNPNPRTAPVALLQALQSCAQVSTVTALREQHGRDESAFAPVLPDAVVFADSTQAVADTVALCAKYQTPLVPFGVGSSLEGQVLPVEGGVSLDLSRMNQVLALYADDFCVRVQAGVTRTQLNQAIKHSGLFFPIDPGADASIGGMCATRASGTTTVRYGTMSENVLGLQVVDAHGRVLETGTRARKSSAGYDLTRLLVGSEGTLGVITEVTLRLYPLPEAVSAAVCSFSDIGGCVNATIAIIQMGIPIARCEFVDAYSVRAVNAYAKLQLQESPMLLMEFHGSPGAVAEQAQIVQALCEDVGGSAFAWADTPEQRKRLWAARHNAFFAALQTRPGCKAITTDACVPISCLADCVLACAAEAEASGIPCFLLGHVGDGNFHFGYLIDPDNADERARAEVLNQQVVARALKMGGTCTGEHGIGLHKMGFLPEEAGAASVQSMRLIKHALDPHNILNPGKIFAWNAPA